MSITITFTFDTPAEAASALHKLYNMPAEYPISALSGAQPKAETKQPARSRGLERFVSIREAGEALVEAAQVEAAPVEAAPVEAAPVEAAPVEAAPVEAAPVDYDTLAAAVLRLMTKDAAAPKRIATECGHNTFRAMKDAGDTAAMAKAYDMVCAALGG